MKKSISRTLKAKKRANRRAAKARLCVEMVNNANKTATKPPVGCKKVKYHTELAARMALAKCINGKDGKRAERKYYLCPECRCYHLSSKV